MPSIITYSKDRTVCHIEHQPGNGTRYVAVATKLPNDAEQWLVSFPDYPGTCWYFNEGSYIAPSYVAEKLGRGRMTLTADSPDIHEMCKMVALLVPGCTHDAQTDAHGNFPEDVVH